MAKPRLHRCRLHLHSSACTKRLAGGGGGGGSSSSSSPRGPALVVPTCRPPAPAVPRIHGRCGKLLLDGRHLRPQVVCCGDGGARGPLLRRSHPGGGGRHCNGTCGWWEVGANA
jgi:hypothetical protein